jgi:hypothetical protein
VESCDQVSGSSGGWAACLSGMLWVREGSLEDRRTERLVDRSAAKMRRGGRPGTGLFRTWSSATGLSSGSSSGGST